ncbi:MAG TPA: DUF2157 domain-containing protein [Planctomycetes bacterium]|nr:DUF2157 domain-containing protein [Planctomycetota bacterium]
MKNKKVSAQFRKQLKDEISVWQAEDLISPEQANALTQRYQLGKISAESLRTLLGVIYGIGIVLVAIGIISFVAYHWMGMTRTSKVVLVFGAMLACHGIGIYLWQITGMSPKLGHALICLGSLIFGANIGLMAQIFHVKSQWNGMFLPWSIGAITMAYAVSSVPNAAMAIITSFIWFVGQHGWFDSTSTSWWYPFVAAVVFVPFAYIKRSEVVFVMTISCLVVSTQICAAGAVDFFGWLVSALSTGALLFCWGLVSYGSDKFKSFAIPAMVAGVISTGLAEYLFSFQELAEEVTGADRLIFGNSDFLHTNPTIASLVVLLLLLPFAIKRIRNHQVLKAITRIIIATLVVVTGSAFINEILLVVVANIGFLVMAAVLVWAGCQLENRRLFWVGVLMVALMVVSRTLEYETGLLIKSAAFTACGVGLVVTGGIFEKYLKRRRTAGE